MGKLKICLFTTLGAAALVACGGNEPSAEQMQSAEGMVAMAAGDEESISQRKAAWVSLSGDASPMEKTLMLDGKVAATQNEDSRKRASVSVMTDGVTMNVDNPPQGWQETIKAALKSGQRVVLLTAGDGDRLSDATMRITGIGVKGVSAVLILQDDPKVESYGLLPFGPDEVAGLGQFMSFTFRRAADRY